jgi:MFS family permease
MVSRLGSAVRAYSWYYLALLTLIYIMGSIDRGVISVIAEPLKLHFHLSDEQIGLLGGMGYSTAYAIAILPAGWLIDRNNRRNLLSITVSVWGILTAVSAFTSTYSTLLIARSLVGAAETPIAPGSLSLIADAFPRDRRNTAVGIYYGGASVGQIMLFLGGGWLLANFDWRSAFLVAGIPAVVLAALLLMTTVEPERGAFDVVTRGSAAHATQAAQNGPLAAALTIWRSWPLLLSIPAIAITSGVPYAVTVWSTSFFVRVHHLTVSQGLTWTGISFGLCMAIGSFAVGPMADRFSRGNPHKLAIIPAVTLVLAIVAGILMLLGPSEVDAIAGLAFFSLMCGFFYPTSYSIALFLSPPEQRGSIMAAVRMISTLLGGGLLPLMIGILSDAIGGEGGIRFALLFAIFLLAVCAGIYGWMYRLLKSEQPVAPEEQVIGILSGGKKL